MFQYFLSLFRQKHTPWKVAKQTPELRARLQKASRKWYAQGCPSEPFDPQKHAPPARR